MNDLSAGAELASKLVGFDTINPPGAERACIEYIAARFKEPVFETAVYDFGPGRANLVVRLPATKASRKPLVFSGHVDTVPLGHAEWSVPPLAGLVKEGRLFGRGSSDMKSGIAAFIAATLQFAELPDRNADVVLVISAGEETGSEGAAWLAARPELLGDCGALIIAEPTGNRPMVGHKGALWMYLSFDGVTAHGSMPQHGVNAVAKACKAVLNLSAFDFNVAPHPVMGQPTLNVGTISGGLNVNSVPDHAVVGLDVRTVEGQRNGDVLEQVAAQLPDARVEPFVDLEPVYTPPDHPWLRHVFQTVEQVTGQSPTVETASYFTDASILKPVFNAPPTVILGPGPIEMAHQTDEYCDISNIDRCVDIYVLLGCDYLT